MKIRSKLDKLSEKYYQTSSLYIACFLFSRGAELVNVRPSEANPKKFEFVFIDTPEREALIQAFNFAKEDSPEVSVDVRKFVMAIKTLKDKLYQER